jgi:pimeloyl-ACP methyl ester carboxylesterase
MKPIEPRLDHVLCLDPAGLHRMAYWEWWDGNPDHRDHVVVCVHGLSRQGRDFDAMAQRLARRSRVVSVDIVGRGQSDWLADPMGYVVPTYVADMVTLMARLNAKTLDWVGTSMGGMIGMGFASRKGSPVRRMVINDVGPTLDPAGLARIGAYVGKAQDFATLEEAATYVQSISETFGPHSREQWIELTRWQVKQNVQGRYVPRSDPGIAAPFKATTPAMAQMGEAMLWAAWDAVKAKTLLVRGETSDLLHPSTAKAMTERGPKAALVTIQGVGHAPMFQHADQIDVVERFLFE